MTQARGKIGNRDCLFVRRKKMTAIPESQGLHTVGRPDAAGNAKAMSRMLVGILVVSISFVAGHAAGSELNAKKMARKFAEAQRKNQEILEQYTWKSKTVVQLKRHIEIERLFQAKFNEKGELERILLEEKEARRLAEDGKKMQAGQGELSDKKKKKLTETAREILHAYSMES
jgi:hypothetical protein